MSLEVSEKQWQRTVEELARLRGWLRYHTRDSRGSEPGFPDLVLVRGRRLLFVELKTAKGKPSPEQLLWMNALRETPAEVYLWRPADWVDVQRILK
jgi:hypothetical protein